jgi:hypothetical protein
MQTPACRLLLQQQQKAHLPTISPEQLTKIPEDLVCAFQVSVHVHIHADQACGHGTGQAPCNKQPHS